MSGSRKDRARTAKRRVALAAIISIFGGSLLFSCSVIALQPRGADDEEPLPSPPPRLTRGDGGPDEQAPAR